MSLVPIPNLPAAISLTGAEQLEAVQSGTSVRVTAGQIASLFGPAYTLLGNVLGFASIQSLINYPKPNVSASSALAAIVVEYSPGINAGGAAWRWYQTSTATADNICVVNPIGNLGSGRWIIIADEIDQFMAGCVGDADLSGNGTDDSVAIQAWIDSVYKNKKKGAMILSPNGHGHKTTTTIYWDNPGSSNRTWPGYTSDPSPQSSVTFEGVNGKSYVNNSLLIPNFANKPSSVIGDGRIKIHDIATFGTALFATPQQQVWNLPRAACGWYIANGTTNHDLKNLYVGNLHTHCIAGINSGSVSLASENWMTQFLAEGTPFGFFQQGNEAFTTSFTDCQLPNVIGSLGVEYRGGGLGADGARLNPAFVSFNTGTVTVASETANFNVAELTFATNPGAFTEGETVTQSSTAATGLLQRLDAINNIMYLKATTGTFDAVHAVTGGTSGHSATPNSVDLTQIKQDPRINLASAVASPTYLDGNGQMPVITLTLTGLTAAQDQFFKNGGFNSVSVNLPNFGLQLLYLKSYASNTKQIQLYLNEQYLTTNCSAASLPAGALSLLASDFVSAGQVVAQNLGVAAWGDAISIYGSHMEPPPPIVIAYAFGTRPVTLNRVYVNYGSSVGPGDAFGVAFGAAPDFRVSVSNSKIKVTGVQFDYFDNNSTPIPVNVDGVAVTSQSQVHFEDCSFSTYPAPTAVRDLNSFAYLPKCTTVMKLTNPTFTRIGGEGGGAGNYTEYLNQPCGFMDLLPNPGGNKVATLADIANMNLAAITGNSLPVAGNSFYKILDGDGTHKEAIFSGDQWLTWNQNTTGTPNPITLTGTISGTQYGGAFKLSNPSADKKYFMHGMAFSFGGIEYVIYKFDQGLGYLYVFAKTASNVASYILATVAPTSTLTQTALTLTES